MPQMTPRPRRARAGFTMLEVMIALSLLTLSLFILIQAQSSAVIMTDEADRILNASQLAQEKLAEVRFLVENEGFQDGDVWEEGDFDDFGDEAVSLEFSELEDYHWEYLVTEVDLETATNLSATMNNLAGSLSAPGQPPPQMPNLSQFGISEDTIADMLNPFLREVKVRVWWGEDLEEAEEIGNQVVITTHLINPHGNMLGAGGVPTMPGGAGGLNGGGAQGLQQGGMRGGARGGTLPRSQMNPRLRGLTTPPPTGAR